MSMSESAKNLCDALPNLKRLLRKNKVLGDLEGWPAEEEEHEL